MVKILMVKIGEKTHKELMRLKYKLGERSASTTIAFLIENFNKSKLEE